MYKVHQDAVMLPVELDSGSIGQADRELPVLSASASRDQDGLIHLSLCNLHLEDTASVRCILAGAKLRSAAGRVLTDTAMNAHNTFDQPNRLSPAAFTDFTLQGEEIYLKVPAKSVLVLSLSE
jgi:alpha-N-arabinofuranosidase